MSAQFWLVVGINAAINAVVTIACVLIGLSLYHRWESSGEAKTVAITIGIVVLLIIVISIALTLSNL